ncbi:hypothetical protein N7451_000410 [Penicillium sp. IBT 35674x]|nr:hypothetical protein N7451_000410 [Penicillium sp. IBT 35674x]
MADKQTGPIHEHESFFDRILHRHKKENKHEQEHEHEAKDPSKDSRQEGEMDKMKDHMKTDDAKFKDYMHKEGELEAEGDTYDRLM